MLAAQAAFAQGRGGRGGPPAPPQTPKAAALIDVTGYWVSVVTEDWRYRMVAPTKGDYQGVPMTPDARKDRGHVGIRRRKKRRAICARAYGAPAILRSPPPVEALKGGTSASAAASVSIFSVVSSPSEVETPGRENRRRAVRLATESPAASSFAGSHVSAIFRASGVIGTPW